jgi:hypothetical protein
LSDVSVRGASTFAVLLVAAGCGADDVAEPSPVTEPETAAETSSGKGVVVARARLREGKALEPQAEGEPFPGYDYLGPVRVIVELKRADDGSFVLVMQGVTHDIEPHTLRLATSTTCTNYARDMGGVKGVEGEAVVHKAFRGRGDAPWGGTVHERNVLPVTAEVASKLLAEPITVFADAGGAHGGRYLYCGTVATKQP